MKSTIKTALVFIVTILISTTVNAQWNSKKIKGNGNVKTITRTTSEYDAIKCAGSMDYILVKGTEGQIKIEGEENLLEYVITEVKDNTLKVRLEKGVHLKSSLNKSIKITIPFKDINAVALAGSGDLWNTDTIKATNLDVALAGSGDLTLDVDATTVDGSLAGSGDLVLKGKTDNFEASVAGSGDLSAFGLQANNTEVSVAGSGDAEVVSNTSLKARVSGSGDIQYRGNPSKEDTKVVGSGSISN